MDFLVEKLTDRDVDFSLKDVKLFHRGCQGGIVKIEQHGDSWALQCKRCGEVQNLWPHQAAAIISTAFDGEKRQITGSGDVIRKP